MTPKKRAVLIGFALGLIALFLLSTSISEIDFKPGRPVFSIGEADGTGSAPTLPPPEADEVGSALLAILFWIIVPISIIYVILNPKSWKRILRQVAIVTMIVLAIFLFIRALNPSSIGFEQPSLPTGSELFQDSEQSTLQDELQFEISQLWAIGVGFLLLLFGLVVGFLLFRRSKSRHPEESELDHLMDEAAGALDKLRSGGDLKETVIRCYQEMCDTFHEEQGIARRGGMTAREFQLHLSSAGLKDDHIEKLTRLFERVRYGDQSRQPELEREAEQCLAEIVKVYARST